MPMVSVPDLRSETQELAEQVSRNLQRQLHEELQDFLKQLRATLSSDSKCCRRVQEADKLKSSDYIAQKVRSEPVHEFHSPKDDLSQASCRSPMPAVNDDDEHELSLLSFCRKGYHTTQEIEIIKRDSKIVPSEKDQNTDTCSDQSSSQPIQHQLPKGVSFGKISTVSEQSSQHHPPKNISFGRTSTVSEESEDSTNSCPSVTHLATDASTIGGGNPSDSQQFFELSRESRVFYHKSRSKMKRQKNVSFESSAYQSIGPSLITRLVGSLWFDAILGVSIIANAILIGVQADWSVKHRGQDVPEVFRVCDLIFCTIFVVELALRLHVFRLNFFCMRGWGWNLFDTLIVFAQVLEEALIILGGTLLQNLSFMRIVRIFRLIRIIRLVRILRLIGELRLLVLSIIHSLKSLCWTIVLIVLLMYINAIWLTQLVADQTEKADDSLIFHYFGSLMSSILSLFQSITGGVDWDNAMRPLVDEINPFWGFVYCLYIAFSVFAMLNVVTGVFVESALQSANQDKDTTTVCTMGDFFQNACGRGGKMSWKTFSSQLHTQHMKDYFKLIDMDISEARAIFRLLDMNQRGSIDMDEFLSGCVRLRGSAKAIDLAILMHGVRRIEATLKAEVTRIEEMSDMLEQFRLFRSSQHLPCPPEAAQRSHDCASEQTNGVAVRQVVVRANRNYSDDVPPTMGIQLRHAAISSTEEQQEALVHFCDTKGSWLVEEV